jgi:hypothetical protein
MGGDTSPLPNTPSWRGAQLKKLRGLKSHFASGIGLAIKFSVASGILKSNFSDCFLRSRLVEVPTPTQTRRHRCLSLLYPPNGRLTTAVPEGGGGGTSIMAHSCLNSSLHECKATGLNADRKAIENRSSSIPDRVTRGD